MASRLAAWLLTASLVAAPLTSAHAAATPVKRAPVAAKAKPKAKVAAETTTTTEKLRPSTLGSFTPSLVDPARSAAVRTQSVERSFRFTPSGKGDRKALTVGLTSRVVTPASPATAAARATVASNNIEGLTPSGYNLGVSVGYQGFSLTGGYSRFDGGLGLRREGVDLGLSYRGKRWKASLQASGEEPSHDEASLMLDKRYSLELGGAYALTPRLSLQGGMRYQLITPLDPKLNDEEADPSVYLGTSFRF